MEIHYNILIVILILIILFICACQLCEFIICINCFVFIYFKFIRKYFKISKILKILKICKFRNYFCKILKILKVHNYFSPKNNKVKPIIKYKTQPNDIESCVRDNLKNFDNYQNSSNKKLDEFLNNNIKYSHNEYDYLPSRILK